MSLSKLTKKQRKLYLEYLKIIDKIRNLPYVELDKPIHKGWNIIHTLRQDILNRKDADILKKALVLGTYNYSLFNSNHIRQIRKGNYTYNDYVYDYKLKKYVFINKDRRHVKDLNQDEFDKIPDNLKKYFDKRLNKYGRIFYKLNFPKYYYKLKVKKRYVTKVQGLDNCLESRRSEIYNYFVKYNLWNKIHDCNYNYTKKYKYTGERNKNKNILKQEITNLG